MMMTDGEVQVLGDQANLFADTLLETLFNHIERREGEDFPTYPFLFLSLCFALRMCIEECNEFETLDQGIEHVAYMIKLPTNDGRMQ